ncbi:hypothetical protein WME89_27325 [Sorangium sp. So ce321]|uniref:hypothetical protein n=1 Tax=Sorangium sp. So ce321 TaxID=3133300 RepID=UPI003F5F9720
MTSLAVVSLAAASLITLGSASASAKDHTDWALEFINNAVSNSVTDEGEDCFMNWGDGTPAAWSAKTKGACFFTLSLQKAMGYAKKDIGNLWFANSPVSDVYFDYINMSPALGAPPLSEDDETHFRRVSRAIDIQRGDILVVGATGTYPGHTVIITGAPTEILPQINPRYAGTKQYAVPIVDSTTMSHGCNTAYPDSRWSGPCVGGSMADGAGTGYMRVYTDSITNILLGYTWSVTSSTTTYYSPSTRPFRVGRLFKLPPPAGDDLPPPPP